MPVLAKTIKDTIRDHHAHARASHDKYAADQNESAAEKGLPAPYPALHGQKVEFPKWKHHKSNDSMLVHSPEEEDALGPEYSDLPTPKPVEKQLTPQEEMAKMKAELAEMRMVIQAHQARPITNVDPTGPKPVIEEVAPAPVDENLDSDDDGGKKKKGK